jgi:hypothetical protein
MQEIEKGLTKEEYSRLRKYISIVLASKGEIYFLTWAEQSDFGELLKKTMLAQALFTEEDIRSIEN